MGSWGSGEATMAPSFISKENNGLVPRGLEAPALAPGLTLTALACVYMCAGVSLGRTRLQILYFYFYSIFEDGIT